MHIINNK